MNSTKFPKLNTWGAVQQAKLYGPDIIEVSTAGHGGFIMKGAARTEARRLAGNWSGWNDDPAVLEEDKDALFAVFVAPQYFDSRWAFYAIACIDFENDDYWSDLKHLKSTPAYDAVRGMAEHYQPTPDEAKRFCPLPTWTGAKINARIQEELFQPA
jgi:hypothetical protein